MRSVRFQIVDFREDPPQSSNINGLRPQLALPHQHGQKRQDLLRAPQGEGRDHDRSLPFEHAIQGLGEPFDFRLARKIPGRRPIAARGLQDQHVRLYVLEPGLAQDGLVVEADVTRVKKHFLLAAHHDARRTERVAGIIEFQCRR